MENKSGYQFGTFKGVFTPSLLTILGIIMYLRFGWVLGNVGLTLTIVIVTLSTAITFLTGLSISALATNMKVGGGGPYYIISRSLGVELGASIGLPLFLAMGLGISFYVVGFAEAIVNIFPALGDYLAKIIPSVADNKDGVATMTVGVVTLVGLFILVYFSSDIALKSQYFILAAIAVSLVSFFAGPDKHLALPAGQPVPPPQPFWIVFAVFFPAVTGILAGVSMSGDLKNPARSLPLGTLAAILVSYAIYLTIPFFLARKVTSPGLLRVNYFIMRDVAYFGKTIDVAIWGATLSGAIGTLLGAPRILQALAKDRVIPGFLGRGFGKKNEPRIAIAVSFLFGLAGILMGDLNKIAPILSMFFLTCYGMLNLSAAFEGLIGSPSWRPKFRVYWSFSLAGAFGCFAVMFMINAGATFIALFVCLMVFYLMQRRKMNAQWGDTRYGIFMLLASYAINKIGARKPDERSWTPNILALSGAPTSRWHLIELADSISHGKGFLTLATILRETGEREENIKSSIMEFIHKKNVSAMVKIHTAENTFEGMSELIRSYGFGPLTPNTVLLGEPRDDETIREYPNLIRLLSQKKYNMIIFKEEPGPGTELEKRPRIDIWWGGKRQNVGLMIALGYLLTRSPAWSKARLVLKSVICDEIERGEAQKLLNHFTYNARLDAETEILLSEDKKPFKKIIESSKGARLVFIGIRPPNDGELMIDYTRYYKELMEKISALPPTAVVMAAEDIEFQRIFS